MSVERSVLVQPLGGGLRAHLGHTRNVVDAIAGQRQQIEHLIGAHAKLVDDTGLVERLACHGVDERNVRTHQLRKILVRCRDQRVHASRRRLSGERADYIVRLDALDHQQWPAVRAHTLQWLYRRCRGRRALAPIL
jgi:hypothetical protein